MQITRRAWLAAAGCSAITTRLKAAEGLFHATSINHLSLTVPDVKRAGEFYARVLGTRVIRDMGESGQMRGLKRNYLALFQGEKAGLNHFSPGVDGLDEPGAGAILKEHGYEPFERAPEHLGLPRSRRDPEPSLGNDAARGPSHGCLSARPQAGLDPARRRCQPPRAQGERHRAIRRVVPRP